MNQNDIFARGISRKWNAPIGKNSSTHQVRLLLEPGNWEEFDPFLILAEDWFQRGTFALHPHRGIETVTYVINGKLEHFDNKAGDGKLLPGDVQWMTAGRGVIHSEDPAEGETVHSLQLWINLPSTHKMAEPRYQNLRGSDMPIREEKGANIRVFSGSSGNKASETKNHVPVTMVEINLDPDSNVTQELPGDYNGFIYVLEGDGLFGQTETPGKAGEILWLGPSEKKGSVINITSKTTLRVLLYAGRPIQERIVAKGPFVMNSEEEIRQAYKDYMEGKFD